MILDIVASKRASHISGWGVFQSSDSLASNLSQAAWAPSGKRAVSVVALRVAAGQQPSRTPTPEGVPTAKELYDLFCYIDTDGDGEVDGQEVAAAIEKGALLEWYAFMLDFMPAARCSHTSTRMGAHDTIES